MDTFEILLTFAIVHLLAAASPGPNLIVVSSYSAASRRQGLLVSFGLLLAVLTWASATALGLVALLSYHLLYQLIQYAGAAYLCWIGLNLLRAGFMKQPQALAKNMVEQSSPFALMLRGYLVNMTNPKTIAYYTSLFAVLIAPDSPVWLFAASVAVAVTVSTIWWIFVVFVFSNPVVQNSLYSSRRYLDIIMGGTLILLGIRLATER